MVAAIICGSSNRSQDKLAYICHKPQQRHLLFATCSPGGNYLTVNKSVKLTGEPFEASLMRDLPCPCKKIMKLWEVSWECAAFLDDLATVRCGDDAILHSGGAVPEGS